MKILKFGTLVSFLTLCLKFGPVQAGIEIRNGGDELVCTLPDGSSTFELLDLYEARIFDGVQPRIDSAISDPFALASSLFSRLQKVDPERAARFKSRVEAFNEQIQFVPGFNINDVRDDGAIGIPKNCHLEQFAIQSNNQAHKKFIISQDIWNKASVLDRAMLIVHELLYEEQIFYGEINSIHVRKFDAILLSGEDVRLTNRCAYVDFLMDLNEKYTVYLDGIEFAVAGLELSESCKARTGHIVHGGTFIVNGSSFLLSDHQDWRIDQESGLPSKIRFRKVDHLQINGCEILLPELRSDVTDPYSIRFDPQGRIVRLELSESIQAQTASLCQVDRKVRRFLLGGKTGSYLLEFFPNGQVKQGILAANQSFFGSNGTIVPASVNLNTGETYLTRFYPSGALKFAYVDLAPSHLTSPCLRMSDKELLCNKLAPEYPPFNFDERGYVAP